MDFRSTYAGFVFLHLVSREETTVIWRNARSPNPELLRARNDRLSENHRAGTRKQSFSFTPSRPNRNCALAVPRKPAEDARTPRSHIGSASCGRACVPVRCLCAASRALGYPRRPVQGLDVAVAKSLMRRLVLEARRMLSTPKRMDPQVLWKVGFNWPLTSPVSGLYTCWDKTIFMFAARKFEPWWPLHQGSELKVSFRNAKGIPVEVI